MFTFINSDKAPAAIGPYSQAVKLGNVLFTSGQIPIDSATGEIIGSDIKEQTRRICENLAAVLKEAGADFSRVVKTTCFFIGYGRFCGI